MAVVIDPSTWVTEKKGETLKMDLVKLIELADEHRTEIVPCIIGDPGIGKTQAVYRFAKQHDRKVVELDLIQRMPNEITGLVMPDTETHDTLVFDNKRLAEMEDGDILFLDELLQAPMATLAACLTLIQERRLTSGRRLADVLIVAAANPLPTIGSIPLSIRQRFLFYEYEWDADDWREYMQRTRKVNVQKLLPHIRLSSNKNDSYNVLTPRSASKLVDWYVTSSDAESVKQIIAHTYDEPIANAVSEVCETARMQNELERWMNQKYPEYTGSLEPADVLPWLEQLPEWNIIQDELAHMS